MPRAYTFDDVVNFVSQTGCELLSTEYKGVYEKLRFRCPCGREFEKAWNHFRYDKVKRCPACAKDFAASKRRSSLDHVQELLREHGCEYLSGEYKNRKSKIRVRCSCGHEKVTTVNVVTSGMFSGLCDACMRKESMPSNRLVRDTIADRCKALGLELLSDSYVSAKEPIRLRCSCGREFTTTWNYVKTKGTTRCPVCSGYQSRGVSRIEDWLVCHGLSFEKEKTFPDCGPQNQKQRYRFDFYLPNQNTCIEYDGEQHFRIADFGGCKDEEFLTRRLLDTARRDEVKTQYCEDKGIQLIRIKYTEIGKIPELLSDKLIPR